MMNKSNICFKNCEKKCFPLSFQVVKLQNQYKKQNLHLQIITVQNNFKPK